MLNSVNNGKIKLNTNSGNVGSVNKMSSDEKLDSKNLISQVVKLMTDYADYNIDFSEFSEGFGKLSQSVKENRGQFPAWLIELIDKYDHTDSEKASESDKYLHQTEFDYRVMKQLYALKLTGSYTDIITNDYSKYI